jgi:hypothetical protein
VSINKGQSGQEAEPMVRRLPKPGMITLSMVHPMGLDWPGIDAN